MISAWKRLINKDNGVSPSPTAATPPGVTKLDRELQKKFSRGVNYNMKVVIKGDNKVGKTSLFLRLKNCGFDENYTPTETLNVTSIDWNYKATDDIVKIDLWEAIEVNSKRSFNFVDLKTNNQETGSPAVDCPNGPINDKLAVPKKTEAAIMNTMISINDNGNATCPIPESARRSLAELCETLDVYQGAHAVFLVMDMTKNWTFKYIQNELPKVPSHIPILVINNHRDQGHHRTVSAEQVKSFIEGQDRTKVSGTIMYTEASMKNGFGLNLIEKFLNIPFLKLQEDSLLKQLETNRKEFLATQEELNLMQDSINREYEQYLEIQAIMRRQQADAMSPVNSGLRELDEHTREQIRNTNISSDLLDKNINAKSIESDNSNKNSSTQVIASQNFVNDRLPSIVIGAKCPLPQKNSTLIATSESSQMSTSEGRDKKDSAEVDDSDESEPEALRVNPLVANYQSDLDSDDQLDQDGK